MLAHELHRIEKCKTIGTSPVISATNGKSAAATANDMNNQTDWSLIAPTNLANRFGIGFSVICVIDQRAALHHSARDEAAQKCDLHPKLGLQ